MNIILGLKKAAALIICTVIFAACGTEGMAYANVNNYIGNNQIEIGTDKDVNGNMTAVPDDCISVPVYISGDQIKSVKIIFSFSNPDYKLIDMYADNGLTGITSVDTDTLTYTCECGSSVKPDENTPALYLYISVPDSNKAEYGCGISIYSFEVVNCIALDDEYNEVKYYNNVDFTDLWLQPYGGWDGQQNAVFKGYSITLDGNIGLNYYYSVPYPASDYKIYAVFVKDYESITVPYEPDNSKYGYYRFTCSVKSNELNKIISGHIEVLDKDGKLVEKTPDWSYSVNDYLNSVDSSDTKLKDLTDSISDYGRYSQLYFGYDTDNIPDAKSDLSSIVIPDEYSCITQEFDGAEKVTYKGFSLVLNSDTDLRCYINETKDIENVCFAYTSEGETLYTDLRYSGKNKLYYGEISGIPAHKLGQAYEVYFCTKDTHEQISSKEIYSVLSYCKKASECENEKLINLVKAIYMYNQKALIYMESIS